MGSGEIIGRSAQMLCISELIQRIAPFEAPVLIVGETGTGKELVARAIFESSKRRAKPFITQNCAALAENLLDNELFGHSVGAYTGANQDRHGLFEAAHTGTVFLDELGEMPVAMQAKLLRVLEYGELRRLGDMKTRKIDVRLICSTHRNMAEMVAAGAFRADLFYRLKTTVVELPPLRTRSVDIPALVEHFTLSFTQRTGARARQFTTDAVTALCAYSWPGNVRELAHTVEHLLMVSQHSEAISADSIQAVLNGGSGIESGSARRWTLDEQLADHERRLIGDALAANGDVIAKAARALGIDRTTLSKRIRRLGLARTVAVAR